MIAVEVATARLQAALDLLAEDEHRDVVAERVSREVSASVQDTLSRARAKQEMQKGTIHVPEKWLTELVTEVLDDWCELAREARESGQTMRASYIAQRADQLGKDVEKFIEREKLWNPS